MRLSTLCHKRLFPELIGLAWNDWSISERLTKTVAESGILQQKVERRANGVALTYGRHERVGVLSFQEDLLE